MISGLADALIGSWLYLAAAGVAPADLDSLLAALAREPPQSIAFVEIHTSPLLEHDLVVAGSLEYGGSGKLSRVVTNPYRERTDIEGGEVRIQRDGRPERRFPLRRNRELGDVLSAFSALLAGDRVSLERSFEAVLELQPAGWELDLAPRNAGKENRISRIRVRGVGGEPACITVVTREGKTATEILVGAAASDPDHEGRRREHCGERT
jgi:Outer membrane lipoprotein carrier protein LolA-like